MFLLKNSFFMSLATLLALIMPALNGVILRDMTLKGPAL